MRKKFLALFIALACAITCVPALAGCGDGSADKAHNLVYNQATESTCNAKGNIEYWHCLDCGKNFSDKNGTDEVVDVSITTLAHNYENKKCTSCGATQLNYYSLSNDYEWIEDTCCVTGALYFDEETDVVIPAYNNGLPVVGLEFPYDDSYWFYAQKILSITLPETITSIAVNFPLEDFTNLKFNVYDNAKYLGTASNPFFALIKATSQDITSCEIHPDTNIIVAGAFMYCNNLRNITIPESVTTVERSAFYSNNLNFNVYDNVKYLGSANNPYFALIASDNIERTACDINPNTKIIATGAFSNCENLENVAIPDGVVSIGANAFYNASKNGGSNLLSVTIPNSVTKIDIGRAFSNNKTILYCEAESRPSGWHNDFDISFLPVIWDYKNNDKDQKGNAYTTIDGIRYMLNDGVATVTLQSSKISGDILIPSSVKYKGNAYNVTSIANAAFQGCQELTGVTIPDGVTSISGWAFWGCNNLKSAVIPSSVKEIGNASFSYCPNLSSIDFKGTKEQWEAIVNGKNFFWETGSRVDGGCTVTCTDGKLNLE